MSYIKIISSKFKYKTLFKSQVLFVERENVIFELRTFRTESGKKYWILDMGAI
jgi:hypothetical protein